MSFTPSEKIWNNYATNISFTDFFRSTFSRKQTAHHLHHRYKQKLMLCSENSSKSMHRILLLISQLINLSDFMLSMLWRLWPETQDAKLLTDLVDGVDLGIHNAIEPSGTWPLKQDDPDMNPNEFSSFETNWKSADTDEITLERLIQREIDDGFVTELPSLDSAKDQFGDLLAIGKLGIATQQADKPRLVLDSTISGLNPASNRAILEKYGYPKLRDLQSSFPQATRNPNVLLNVDVKSAHKRIKVRKEHQGLLAFRFKERIFHYKVLHFGGSCSAYYWTRTAGHITSLHT